MKLSTTVIALSAMLMAQPATVSWTWTYREANDTPHVIQGSNNKACSVFNHGKGKKFNWDRSTFSDCCIRLYINPSCSGDMAGFSCWDWKNHVSSVGLLSYKVTDC